MFENTFRRFFDEESGAITPFILVLFIIMVVGGGMATDFMRHESEREILQDALDRAVLSAASFDQVADPELVVISYLRGNTAAAINLEVSQDITLNYRSIGAVSNYDIKTYFLKLIGIKTLTVRGRSFAETRVSDIEVSLILDVSGSMRGHKLASLKLAAKEFIDTVITDETRAYTSMSIVPFSAQVAASENLANQYNLNASHRYSWCFDFEEDDFSTTGMSPQKRFTQNQHWGVGWSDRDFRWCPRAANQIHPLSNNNNALRNSINRLHVELFTATWAGMKWGVSLLDPSTQPVVNGLIQVGDVSADFADRPAAWNDENTLKFAILMTDGQNTGHRRVDPNVYNRGSGNPPTQADADHWNRNRPDMADSGVVVDGDAGDVRLASICAAAKASGIIVYTIGFRVRENSNPYNAMRSCATSPLHFFHVEGMDLSTTFQMIATSMQKLKLVE